jgi:hypothetical protein
MANKVSLSFDGFEQMAEKLDRISNNLKGTTEQALKKSFEIIQPKVKKAVRKNNLPRKGKYSTGISEESVLSDDTVVWKGTVGSIGVGFDFDVSGLRTVMLMYGTPTMAPVKGLKAAVYGPKTKKEISATQKEIFEKAIKEAMDK